MKLHIGGEEVKADWKILNISNKPGVDYIGDISNLSQFTDNSFQEIYASHVVEHPSSTPNPVFPVFCPLDPNKIKHLALPF